MICVSWFIRMKQLDIFDETSGHFPAMYMVTEPGILIQNMT